MFQGFYDETSIKHQLTNTYTPQQNGVSERKNRSLMDMARCLLFERNLPKTFWAKEVNTAVYLQNRLPINTLFRFKPSLAHLKVFGCIYYAHVPTVKRDKLAKKAQPGMLVGYSSVKKGYKILDPSSNRVFVSRDVVFNEKGTRPLAKIYERTDVAAVESSYFEEAEAQQGWKQAMLDELIARPANRKVNGVKWVFRAKHNADENLNKLKARLIVKGFMVTVLIITATYDASLNPPKKRDDYSSPPDHLNYYSSLHSTSITAPVPSPSPTTWLELIDVSAILSTILALVVLYRISHYIPYRFVTKKRELRPCTTGFLLRLCCYSCSSYPKFRNHIEAFRLFQ
ncbi:Zinc finger, CCHC-type [Gossypium australe]|uniref:Zinc finger, CCHC-type n=1 Tax=Gossypium australe TaxID=47621 RepID=A0A5B6WKG6_9ROSI|nr:Zinc finger, CCHC-type [Gossypium australe]